MRRVSLVGAVAQSAGNLTAFYTVQGPEAAARLRGSGEPWPTSPVSAHLGEGVYAWVSRAVAEAYLVFRAPQVPVSLQIVRFEVDDRRLRAYRHLDVDALGVPGADEWLDRYSRLRGGLPDHGLEYIRRGTRFGTEHFFHKAVFGDLRFR